MRRRWLPGVLVVRRGFGFRFAGFGGLALASLGLSFLRSNRFFGKFVYESKSESRYKCDTENYSGIFYNLNYFFV